MKTLNLLNSSLIVLFVLFCSCDNHNKKSESKSSKLDQQLHSISLKDPVLLNNKQTYNLHWDSNIADYDLVYSLIVNDEIIENELTKTIISENENTIEFNVPSTDYSISSEQLNSGINTIQIKAKHGNSSLSYFSNKITLDHKKSDYLALR